MRKSLVLGENSPHWTLAVNKPWVDGDANVSSRFIVRGG